MSLLTWSLTDQIADQAHGTQPVDQPVIMNEREMHMRLSKKLASPNVGRRRLSLLPVTLPR
jgi:hypothetical protein